MNKEYIKIKIKDIIPYEKNPRKNDNAVPDVAESIKQVGYITPIVVDENNVVYAVELSCAIGDDTIDEKPYSEIVEIAQNYIKSIGGFEKFAEWGLI